MFQVDFWSEVKRQKCIFSCSRVSAKSAFLSNTTDNHEQLSLIEGHGLSISRKAEMREREMSGREMFYVVLFFILLLETAVSLHFLLLKKRLCSVAKSVLSREHALLLQQQRWRQPKPRVCLSQESALFLILRTQFQILLVLLLSYNNEKGKNKWSYKNWMINYN